MFPVFLKLFALISNMCKLQINFHTLSTTLKILSVLKMQSKPVVCVKKMQGREREKAGFLCALSLQYRFQYCFLLSKHSRYAG